MKRSSIAPPPAPPKAALRACVRAFSTGIAASLSVSSVTSALSGIDPRHLAEHAVSVITGAPSTTPWVAPRSMKTLREIRVGRLVQHLGGHASAR